MKDDLGTSSFWWHQTKLNDPGNTFLPSLPIAAFSFGKLTFFISASSFPSQTWNFLPKNRSGSRPKAGQTQQKLETSFDTGQHPTAGRMNAPALESDAGERRVTGAGAAPSRAVLVVSKASKGVEVFSLCIAPFLGGGKLF